MLTMRDKQVETFRQYMQDRFGHDMAAHLRTRFPEQTEHVQEAELRETVHRGIEKAGTYGVQTRYDLRRYLEHMTVYGPDFDTDPTTAWAGRILNDAELSGSAKMDRIDEHATFATK
jgi:hypothetical protein